MVINLSPTVAYAVNVFMDYVVEFDPPHICKCAHRISLQLVIENYRDFREAALKDIVAEAQFREEEKRKEIESFQKQEEFLKTEILKLENAAKEREREIELYKEGEKKEDLIKNHSCDVCFQTFSKRANLDRHRKTHSEESFPCEFCSKHFTRSDIRKRHIRTKHIPENLFRENLEANITHNRTSEFVTLE